MGAEATAFLARTSGLDATHTAAYTELIDGLVAIGVWAKLDVLHIYATQDTTTAQLNLVQSSYPATLNGSPTFTADRGYTGTSGSSTKYIDTGFNPTTASSPKFGTNGHISCWPLNNTTDTNEAIGLLNALGNGTLIYPRYTNGNTYFRVNSQAVGNVVVATSNGHYLANRSASGGSSASEGYKNGASILTDGTQSVAIQNGNIYTIAGNLQGTARGSPYQLAMASIGGSLTATEAQKFYEFCRDFLVTVGAVTVDVLSSHITNDDTFYAPTVAFPAQTLISSLVTDTETFFAPSLASTYTLTPALFDDTNTFYTPSVAITDQTLIPALFSDTDTFFAPTATAGSVTLTAALFTDTDTFFAPAVSAGDVTLSPPLFADTDTFYAPTATYNYTLTAALVTDTDTFFAPTVTAQGSVNPGLIASDDTFYAPTVVPGAVSVLPGLVVDTDTIYAPTADNRYSLLPSLFNDADTFYAPTQSNVAYVLPSLVTEADVIYAVTAPNTSTLGPPFIDSDAVIYSPLVSNLGALLPSLFSDADTLFSPTLLPGPVSIFPSRVIDLDIFLTPNVGIVKKGGSGGGGTGGTVTTDLKYASQITMTESGLVYALQADASTAKTINTRMLIYADTGGLPGALLGQSAVKTSVVVGANNYPLLVPVSLLVGQKVWIALHSDGSFNWFLTPSTGGAKYNTDLFSDGPSDPFGPVSNDNKKAPVFVLFLSAASAGVTAGLVTDTDTFYAPAITGNKTLSAPFLDDTDFYLSPVVLPVNVLSPSLVTNDDAIYVPATTRSALLPGVVLDDDTVYSPFVGAHAPTVFGADMPSDDQIYQATVTSFGAGLPPLLFSDDDTLFSPTVTVEYQLGDVLHDDTDVFYAATVAPGAVTLLPPLVTSGEDFWDPAFSRLLGTVEMLPSLFVDDDAFYTPTRVAHKSGRRQVYLDGRNDSNKTLVGS